MTSIDKMYVGVSVDFRDVLFMKSVDGQTVTKHYQNFSLASLQRLMKVLRNGRHTMELDLHTGTINIQPIYKEHGSINPPSDATPMRIVIRKAEKCLRSMEENTMDTLYISTLKDLLTNQDSLDESVVRAVVANAIDRHNIILQEITL